VEGSGCGVELERELAGGSKRESRTRSERRAYITCLATTNGTGYVQLRQPTHAVKSTEMERCHGVVRNAA
jgi:hypothetical protein